MTTHTEPDPLSSWPAYVESCRARLEAGRVTYGDKSFSRSPAELIGELQLEAIDLGNWGYILHARLEAMRAALDAGAIAQRGPDLGALTGEPLLRDLRELSAAMGQTPAETLAQGLTLVRTEFNRALAIGRRKASQRVTSAQQSTTAGIPAQSDNPVQKAIK